MPAHARYPTPAEQMVELAAEARRRGLSFDEFWQRATDPRWPDGQFRLVKVTTVRPPEFAVRWPSDTEERAVWGVVLEETKDAWREGYEQREEGAATRWVRRVAPAERPGFVSGKAVPSAA